MILKDCKIPSKRRYFPVKPNQFSQEGATNLQDLFRKPGCSINLINQVKLSVQENKFYETYVVHGYLNKLLQKQFKM